MPYLPAGHGSAMLIAEVLSRHMLVGEGSSKQPERTAMMGSMSAARIVLCGQGPVAAKGRQEQQTTVGGEVRFAIVRCAERQVGAC